MEHHRAEEAKKKWRKHKKTRKDADFKIRKERKGCLTTSGVCRARFPRDIVMESTVAKDGHIDVRHVEPMINTVNPILTYLNRCNSDVTSLLSGTAVKAVVSYVSDYVSKISLKSYQMFASVYNVFERETEILGGAVREKENARHMMRKMVNSMSSKMELGSPMASLYILGNPDHYASHKYVAFAWRPYVQFIRAFWVTDTTCEDEEERRNDEEKVPIKKREGKFVPGGGVDDYRYRPIAYNNVTLYEWIQCSEKKKRTIPEIIAFEEDIQMSEFMRPEYYKAAMKRLQDDGDDTLLDEDPLEDDCDFEEEDNEDTGGQDDVSDWETDDEEDIIFDKHAKINKSRKPVQHAFLPRHSQFTTHSVTCDYRNLTTIIPNFIGGSMPRSDKGDRASYCMTMLTLFKPWRSPADLKDNLSTWDQAFTEHDFTERQMELLKNFDVRYECNDARDDHFAQMKKK
ncbi:hypothetical protein C8R43DRAFT_883842, partial [Mycena crocata]